MLAKACVAGFLLLSLCFGVLHGQTTLELNHIWEGYTAPCSSQAYDCVLTDTYIQEADQAISHLDGTDAVKRSFERFRSRRQWSPGEVAVVNPSQCWWNLQNCNDAINLAFGAGVNYYTESVAISTVLSPGRNVVIIEDCQLGVLKTWIDNNKAALENFVTNGGAIWQNHGDGVGSALFGAVLTSTMDFSSYSMDLTHDIFDAGLPSTPISEIRGCGNSHYYISSLTGFKSVMSVGGRTHIAEKTSGTGTYILSTLTNPDYIYRVGAACVADQAWSKIFWADIALYAATAALGYGDKSLSCYNKCDQTLWGNPISKKRDGNVIIPLYPSITCRSDCAYYMTCASDYEYYCSLGPINLNGGTTNINHLGATCVLHYNVAELNEIVDGATVMASGGGGARTDGSAYVGLLKQDLQSKSVRILTGAVGCKKPDGICVIAQMGNPQILHNWVNGTTWPPGYGYANQKYDMDNSVMGLYATLKDLTGNNCQAIAPIETGAVNTLVPIYASVLNDRWLMDVDGGGRAVPMLPLTFWAATVLNQPTAPMVAASVFNYTQASPKFQPGWGYQFSAQSALRMQVNHPNFITMSPDQPSYNAIAFNNAAFSGIAVFGNLCCVGFYPMNGTAGFDYGYQGAVTKLVAIGNAVSTGTITNVLSAAKSCTIKGKGILYSVNSWGDAAHQWQYQVTVMTDNTIVSSLALNENALLWVYTDPALTYATATAAGKCLFSTAAVPQSSLRPTTDLKVIAPDSIAQVQAVDVNGVERLQPLSGPDMVAACNTSTTLIYAYNVVAPSSTLWGNSKCSPPSSVPTTCGTPANNFNNGVWSSTYTCFCRQVSTWYAVMTGAGGSYRRQYPTYPFPPYFPVTSPLCVVPP